MRIRNIYTRRRIKSIASKHTCLYGVWNSKLYGFVFSLVALYRKRRINDSKRLFFIFFSLFSFFFWWTHEKYKQQHPHTIIHSHSHSCSHWDFAFIFSHILRRHENNKSKKEIAIESFSCIGPWALLSTDVFSTPHSIFSLSFASDVCGVVIFLCIFSNAFFDCVPV